MKRKFQILIFIIVALICGVLILVTKPPFRNYVPIAWALYGFGLHGFFYVITQMNLNRKLTSDYKHFLDNFGIRNYVVMGIPKVDLFGVLKSKFLFEAVDQKTKDQIKFLKLNLTIAFIAFAPTAIFAILTVVMTWKK